MVKPVAPQLVDSSAKGWHRLSYVIKNIGRLFREAYAHRPAATILSTLGISGGLLYYLNTTRQKPQLKDSTTQRPLKPCRFRLDDSTSATVILSDGRTLGYAEYGSPTGKVIFNLHGLPGSRLEATYNDEIATNLGARLIGIDRPGYGWSTPHPARTLLDHAKDVEQLAAHLNIDEYAVMGTSGGGPYALACAVHIPLKHLKAAVVVCGVGTPDMSKKGMNWMHWLGFALGWPYAPSLCGRYIGRDPAMQLHLSPEERLQRMRTESLAHPRQFPQDLALYADTDLMLDIQRAYVRYAEEILAQGFSNGMVLDGHIMSVDWGFRIEDIPAEEVKIRLWYGKDDTHCPPIVGVETAERLGGKAVLRVEEETHMSLFFNCRERILRDLVECF